MDKRRYVKEARDNFEIGTAKLMLERVLSYVGMLNFAMILYLYATESPLGIDSIYWFVALIIFLPMVMIVDWVFVYPSVLKISYKKNKEFQALRKEIKEIKLLLKK